jgi:hypothetical protein
MSVKADEDLAAEVMSTRVSDDSDPSLVRAFDPRTEVSADARYIVKRIVLWLLGVPLLIAVLIFVWYAIADAQRSEAAAAEAHREVDRTMDRGSIELAGRLMDTEIALCRSRGAPKGCFEKAADTCKSTKLESSDSIFLLIARCTP